VTWARKPFSPLQPAILKGKVEATEEGEIVRPLVWGEEQRRFILPRSEIAARSSNTSNKATATYTCLIPDRTKLAAAYGESVSVFSLPEWEIIVLLRHEFAIVHLAFSPNSRMLVTSAGELYDGARKVSLWNIEAEAKRHTDILGKPTRRADLSHILETTEQAARDAFLSYREDWDIRAWEREAESVFRESVSRVLEGVQHRHFFGSAQRVLISGYRLPKKTSNPFSLDGSKLLLVREWKPTEPPRGTHGVACDLVIWNVDDKCEDQRLEPRHEGAIMWAAYSPDGLWIATSSWDGCVRVWESMTGVLFHTFGSSALQHSWQGQFSPDSKLLAVGNGDANVRIWDTKPAN
jgi:WD40 repeat protein